MASVWDPWRRFRARVQSAATAEYLLNVHNRLKEDWREALRGLSGKLFQLLSFSLFTLQFQGGHWQQVGDQGCHRLDELNNAVKGS